MRWILLDEILNIQKGSRALTRSHVPDAPFSAELLMVEMMAQTGALVLGAEKDFQQDIIFAKIESVSFSDDRRLGEPVEIEAASENLRPEGAWFDAVVRGGRGMIAEGRFLIMDVGHLVPGSEKPITFHDAFMNHFHVRSKIK